MKKFENENEVVLTMSKSELITLGMLVADGVCYACDTNEWKELDMERFRKIREVILE